jgi:transposase
MRSQGSPAELERRRCLAVQRIQEGYAAEEVGDLLGVDPRSVRRWVAALRQQGPDALAARPVPGRPPKLTATQEKIVRRWLADNPLEYGFAPSCGRPRGWPS